MLKKEYFASLEKDEKKSENTILAYKSDVNEFLSCVGKDALEVHETDVIGYLLEMKEKGKSAATINRKLASVRHFYSFLMEQKKVDKNPARKLSVPKEESREIIFLTIEETLKLLELPDDSLSGKRDRAMLELMYATGMMVNELVAAKLSDVNLSLGFITFDGTYGKARIVPIGRPAIRALEDYVENRETMLKGKEDHGALFVNYAGNPLTRQGIWKIMKAYGKKAGFEEKMTPHILRDSFAMHMIENGADLKSLQELMGHEDISATQVYLVARKLKIKEVYDKSHPRAY